MKNKNAISPGIIRADIIASKQAIEYYKNHNIKDIKNIAAYHLQQAAEKIIKFQIYEQVDEINSARIYTHDISKLLLYADSLKIVISVPDEIRRSAQLITSWETGSRYGIGLSIRINSLEKMCLIIEKWSEEVLEK